MKTNIGAYLVEMEIDDGVSSCFISLGNYSASLEALLGEGTLEDGRGAVLEVKQTDIDDIEAWAMDNGY
jgi:hypothetical protein